MIPVKCCWRCFRMHPSALRVCSECGLEFYSSKAGETSEEFAAAAQDAEQAQQDKLCGEDVETAAQEVGDAASSLRSFVITLSANKK